jgi:sulfur carrier protein
MTLTINGKREELDADRLTVVELLKLKDVSMPDMVSVQVNGDVLSRGDYAATLVKDNDQVEFLYFMGGGCQRG